MDHERKHHQSQHKELQHAAEESLKEALANSEGSETERRRLHGEMAHLTQSLSKAHATQEELERRSMASDERQRAAEELLRRSAESFGELAASSTTKSSARRIALDRARLQIYANRLERKVLDREAQVTELTRLIRHTSDQNHLLSRELRDAEEEITYLRTVGSTGSEDSEAVPLVGLAMKMLNVQEEDSSSITSALHALNSLDASLSSRGQSALSQILSSFEQHAQLTEGHERHATFLVDHYERNVGQLAEQLSLLEASVALKQDELEERDRIVEELRTRDNEASRRIGEAEECLAQQVEETKKAKSYQAAQVRTLNEALMRARIGESALQEQVARSAFVLLPF